MSLILASGSPRRKELLALIDDNFKIIVSDAKETVDPADSTEETVIKLSLQKAKAVADRVCADDCVIAADTVVDIHGKILGKPHSTEEAFTMLKMLSGVTHTVYTGVTVCKGNKTDSFSVATLVTFYELSDDEINAYIDTKEPFDKAGAYGIQGKGAMLVKKIDGDYHNVVGLPVGELARHLRQFEYQ